MRADLHIHTCASDGNWTPAELIAEAYKYYPVNEQCLKDLAEAAAIEDAKERYEKYYHCTTIQYNFWEERKVAVIDRS
mgnify:CR=1 FL=1